MNDDLRGHYLRLEMDMPPSLDIFGVGFFHLIRSPFQMGRELSQTFGGGPDRDLMQLKYWVIVSMTQWLPIKVELRHPSSFIIRILREWVFFISF